MAGGAAIGPHNAFKDPVDTDPYIDAAWSPTADATGSSLGNTTAGPDILSLVILKLRWMYSKACV